MNANEEAASLLEHAISTLEMFLFFGDGLLNREHLLKGAIKKLSTAQELIEDRDA